MNKVTLSGPDRDEDEFDIKKDDHIKSLELQDSGTQCCVGARQERSLFFTLGYFVAELNTSGENVSANCQVDVDGQPCNQLVKSLQGNTTAFRLHHQTLTHHKNAFTTCNMKVSEFEKSSSWRVVCPAM